MVTKVILALASFGGHLTQLRKLISQVPACHEVFVISTSALAEVDAVVKDCSRGNPRSVFECIRDIGSLLLSAGRPDVVITTGAAPGLCLVVATRIIFPFVPIIWVDSVANVERISLSGRIAGLIGANLYTQWEELSHRRVFGRKVHWIGNILKFL